MPFPAVKPQKVQPGNVERTPQVGQRASADDVNPGAGRRRQPAESTPDRGMKLDAQRAGGNRSEGAVIIQQQEPTLCRPEPPRHLWPGVEEVARGLSDPAITGSYVTSTCVSSRISQSWVTNSAPQR